MVSDFKISSNRLNTHPFSSVSALTSTKLQSFLSKLTSLRLITGRYSTGRGMLLTITICRVSCLSPSSSSPFPLCSLQMRLLQTVTTFTSLTLQFLCRYCKRARWFNLCHSAARSYSSAISLFEPVWVFFCQLFHHFDRWLKTKMLTICFLSKTVALPIKESHFCDLYKTSQQDVFIYIL